MHLQSTSPKCFVSNAKHRAQKYLNSRIPFGKVLSDVVCPGHLNTPCSGFQRQKEIIHGCFLRNKPVLAVVIIVLITLNHVSFLHYASKVPVGKVSREISCLGNILSSFWSGVGAYLIFLSSVKECIRKGAFRLNNYYNE